MLLGLMHWPHKTALARNIRTHKADSRVLLGKAGDLLLGGKPRSRVRTHVADPFYEHRLPGAVPNDVWRHGQQKQSPLL